MKTVPLEKQSKKEQKKFYTKKRMDWNGIKPVTRIAKSKKIYDRKNYPKIKADTQTG